MKDDRKTDAQSHTPILMFSVLGQFLVLGQGGAGP